MVAQIMFFALGFLIATLLGIAVLPALNARAKRLAQRRVEAILPVSLNEIHAERDLIRAEGALAENRKDQTIARREQALHKAMLETAEKTMKLEKLQATLSALERELAAAQTRIAELEGKATNTAEHRAITEENARLSQRIEELADQLMVAQAPVPSPAAAEQ